ncbi:MAG: Gfo/Idh/MocA family oxidoreductase [Bryobacteraceae bacterium]
MNRRQAIQTLTASSLPFAAPAAGKRYRTVLIGHTGHGNYGHGWDTAWSGFPNVEVVAVADPVEAGRQRVMERTGARKGYASYREMIATEKPDIVTICPRWLDERVPMVEAAAAAGAHILMEKPFAMNLPDADRIFAALTKHRVKLQLGHTARPMGVSSKVLAMLRAGELGVLQEVRARGKEDRRAGGEDLMVLGTHCFDLMRYFAGDPQWVFASITDKREMVTPGMERKASEPIGNIAGDQVSAMFGFPGGVPGFFGSKASDFIDGNRFGVALYCSKAMVFVPLNAVPSAPPYLLRKSSWVGGAWERIEYPEDAKMTAREQTNTVMARDLLEAIEKDREPVCSGRDGRWTIEMVAGIYQSHYAGARLPFPLVKRS